MPTATRTTHKMVDARGFVIIFSIWGAQLTPTRTPTTRQDAININSTSQKQYCHLLVRRRMVVVQDFQISFAFHVRQRRWMEWSLFYCCHHSNRNMTLCGGHECRTVGLWRIVFAEERVLESVITGLNYQVSSLLPPLTSWDHIYIKFASALVFVWTSAREKLIDN